MQRRTFVTVAGTLLSWAGIGSAAPLAGQLLGRPAAGKLSGAAFAALLDQSFNVYENKRGVAMKLSNVRQHAGAGGFEQFSLSLRAPAGTALVSGTYELEHAAIGLVPVYLEALGQDRGALRYRADFNLLA
jgi:hypothetical protein